MHNKFSLSVTLNAVKGLKKIPHCVRNDKFFVQFLDLLIYSLKLKNRKGDDKMDWHSISAEETAKRLETDIKKGLTSAQVRQRTEKYGQNVLTEKKRPGIIRKFLSQLTDFMVLLLLAAAAVSFGIAIFSGDGDLADPIMILLIVVINAVIGTVQESRAEKAIDALKKMSAPHVTVIRDGHPASIASKELVPGDIVTFRAGDIVCADERLLETVAVKSEESSLTGESVPADKIADIILSPDTPPADRVNMLYSSACISAGHGKAVVTSIGMDTQVGRIAAMLSEGEPPQTPLQKSLEKTGKILGICAVGICALIFILGLFQRIPALDMFMISVSLAVAAIPEGLPAVVTIVLALGVRRLAARRAVVRKLPAVETLGSANVICSDKTGTLTQNKMTVSSLYGISGSITAHSPEGRFLLTLGILCNNSVYDKKGHIIGDPTETAITEAAEKAGLNGRELCEKYRRLSEIPFDPAVKKMTTVHSIPEGGKRTITKGAPDVLLGLCSHVYDRGRIYPLSNEIKKRLAEENESLAQQAMRVIAAAYRDEGGASDTGGMIFAGLIGMTDPPRPQAAGAVSLCRKAGIKTVMITGDHMTTAKAIAKQTGIYRDGDLCATGAELDNIDDSRLRRDIFRYSVFARVSPGHKVRIVKAFRSRGAVVAMTGDGVNDAPALRCADIGCAMGKSGTDAAKSAADMILTDDNFATIVGAVSQGRGIFENIGRTIHFLLSSNIGEILTVLCAFLMRLPSPLLAIQLLWINLVTDSLPALALGSEGVADDIMERPPSGGKRSIFTPSAVRSIIIEGLFIGALAFLAYTIGRVYFDKGAEPVIGRTMTFAVLSISQLVHSFNLRSSRSLFKTGISGNPLLIFSFILGLSLQAAVISLPPLQSIFGTAALSPMCWLIAALLSLAPLIVVETEKIILTHTHGNELNSDRKNKINFS